MTISIIVCILFNCVIQTFFQFCGDQNLHVQLYFCSDQNLHVQLYFYGDQTYMCSCIYVQACDCLPKGETEEATDTVPNKFIDESSYISVKTLCERLPPVVWTWRGYDPVIK